MGLIVQPMDANLAEYMGLAADKALMARVVEQNSPAAQAGLKSGDIITCVNGKALSTVEEYTNFEKQVRAGDEIVLEVADGGKSKTVKFKAVNYPDNSGPILTKRLLGFEIKAAPQNQGVSVSAVVPESYLAKQGLRVNDIILGINRVPTNSPDGFYETLIRQRQDDKVTLTIVRGNRRYVIDVPLGN